MRSQIWTFLLSASALSFGCSGYSSVSDYEKIQRSKTDFAEFIKVAGGTAELGGHTYGLMQGFGWTIDLTGDTISEEVIEQIIQACKDDPVFILKLSGSTINDDQLDQLDEGQVLQKVFILDLSQTSVSDAGLDRLDKVYALTELNLKGSQATAASAKRLGERKIASPQTPKPLQKEPKVEI